MDGTECSGDLQRNSCLLSPVENGERDALAAVRMMVSLLSILGASAIITSIIKRKHVWIPTMHPIFQLSIADCLLGLLWIVGSYLWFRGATNRAWCFSVSLLTVILECVTANLTLVYAIVAHSTLKKKRQQTTAMEVVHSSSQIWHPLKSVLIYMMAWTIPAVVVVTMFGIISACTELVSHAEKCSCFCFPHLGNVLPYSNAEDMPSAIYVRQIHKLLVGYSTILLFNFLMVFIIMTWLYQKVLREIRTIKKNIAALDNDVMNFAVRKGQSLARKRILLYLTVFLAIAFSIVILSILVISDGIKVLHKSTFGPVKHSDHVHQLFIIIHLFQSTTVPLQGFMNSIIYGLTRGDNENSIMGFVRDFKIISDDGKNSELQLTSENSDETNVSGDEDYDDMKETQSILHSRPLSYD